MITTKTLVPERKLKIKFTSKRSETDAAIQPCIVSQQVSQGNDYLVTKSSAPSTKKRGPEWIMEIGGQKEKRQKIDRNMTSQCSAILNKLMTHKVGWVFNQPVDPVALHIPDYFSVIAEPMDLGTIKSRLEKNVYAHVNEFAVDVRLTFSNAMLYNPPENNVHQMAKELNQIFERRWKTVDEKYNTECSKLGLEKSSGKPVKNIIIKRSYLGAKRETLSQETVEMCYFEESGAGTVEDSARTAKIHFQKSAKNFNKSSECSSASVKTRPSNPILSKCGSCVNNVCRCSHSSDTAHLSSSDISSDRSLERDHQSCTAASELDCRAKRMLASPARKSDSDVSTLDNENACPSSEVATLVTEDVSRQEENTSLEVPLTPQRALRAALLKCRFADTILKAQQKTLVDGGKNDPEKLKHEKERLERWQREEKARIEAEIRAAEAAAREKAEIELKRQIDRQREAARVAIDKMERTAEIELNLEAFEELEILSGYSPSSSRHLNRDNGRGVLMASSWPVYTGSALERLGLFIKSEYLGRKDEEDEEVILAGCGEGEILETK